MSGIEAARRPHGAAWAPLAPRVALALVAIGAAADLLRLPLGLSELATLVVAPGLALVPLLPEPLRRSGFATLAAVPALGGAATMCGLVTISYAGVPLTPLSVRTLAAVLVLAAWAALWRRPEAPGRASWTVAEGLGLALALGLAGFLALRIVGERPVPGNDWAKYVLYADEIRRQGALLIENPFWLLGVPFREDPGAPALYGAYLLLTGGPAGVLSQGIAVVLLAGVASTFALVRSVGGPLAAALAAGLVAAVPVTYDMLGWHGLANQAALALVPLALAYAVQLVQGALDARQATGFALVVVALAATHRLSLVVCGLALAACAAIALFTAGWQRTLRALAWCAGAAVVAGAGVLADLAARQRTFGGTLPARDYLDTKLDPSLVIRDLSRPFAIVAALALLALAHPAVRSRALIPMVVFVAVVIGLAFAWVVDIPLVYLRMAYYLPLGLAALIAVALSVLLPRLAGVAAGAAIVLVVAASAYGQSGNVRAFYGFANTASLKGLDAVAARLRRGEPVVTDRCWSFLSTWLLRTPTLPALARQDIQPRAELAGVTVAGGVLRGSPAALRFARSLGVRYILIDPQCVDGSGRPLGPPAVGVVVFESPRLAVLELPETPSGLPGSR